MKVKFFLIGLCSFALFFSCSAQLPLSEIQLSPAKRVLFLNGEEAAAAITTDRHDGFFEKVTAAEISIQMKKPLSGSENLDNLRADYIEFLKTDVEAFSPAETDFLAGIIEHVFKTSEQVSKEIFPKELKLIKTKGRHYGNSVYYTRDNCIIIPQNELDNRDRGAMTSVMFHELFHVYSRLNSRQRSQLYGLIGFESLEFGKLVLPEGLAARVLFNPDGVNIAQKITLQTKSGQALTAIPVIFANETGYAKNKSEFFSYLEFNLFEIRPEGNNWIVMTAADGFSSTLNLKELPDFFRQIRDNTHYIIHPDEVLADNFAFLMQSKNDAAVTARFSDAGKNLISEIEKVLTSGSDGRTPTNGSNR